MREKFAAALNADGHAGKVDRAALRYALQRQGKAWQELVAERWQHLFADVAVFVDAAQLGRMYEVIAAVERVVAQPGWHKETTPKASKGVFYGYDFHINQHGVHLIEINTNAGGAFLNALLVDSQREAAMIGAAIAGEALEQRFLAMFYNEWRLARGDIPLTTVAIVDEKPEAQYLYPEFLLAQRMFKRAGITAHIADPAALHRHDDGLFLGEQKIDLVYNRLIDFSLRHYPVLSQAYQDNITVLTPNPADYARYADKRNLVALSDATTLRSLGVCENDIAILQAGVPQTRRVTAADREYWWRERKQWFFKPAMGYGSKGSYSGAKLTRRVFEEILKGGYVAQRMTAPGERWVCVEGGEPQPFKYDVRCYVYDGEVQLIAARLYQGQTTNFRTPGGGFAPVRLLPGKSG